MPLTDIDYPITRTIPWRHLGWLSYAGAFIAVVFLSVLNVALVGYEPNYVLMKNFNYTEHLWFHGLLPYAAPKPGELCEPHLFNVGDQFKMLGGFLDWTIHSIKQYGNNGEQAEPGFSYNGTAMTTCDVTTITANFDGTVQEVVSLECSNVNDGEKQSIEASASLTSFIPQSNEDVADDLLGVSRSVNFLPKAVLSTALLDLLKASSQLSNGSYFAKAVVKTPCFALSANTHCSQEPPEFNGTIITDGGYTPYNWTNFRSDNPELWNFVQTVYAFARVDLHIDSLNNFMLYKNALPQVLTKLNPETNETLYTYVEKLYSEPNGLPLLVDKPPIFQAGYLCKVQKIKSGGSLFVSVFVAVVSMVTAAWGAYKWGLAILAKRFGGPEANTCPSHSEGSRQSPEASIVSDDQDEKGRGGRINPSDTEAAFPSLPAH